MSKEYVVFIPHLSMSLNDYLKVHYRGKSKVKNPIKNFAATALHNLKKIDQPIELEWIPVLTKPKNHSRKKRGYDVLNYCHQYKYTEDQLEDLKKIVNDGNQYVKRHICNTPIYKKDWKSNGIIMIIRELENEDVSDVENKKDIYFNAVFESEKPKVKRDPIQDYFLGKSDG